MAREDAQSTASLVASRGSPLVPSAWCAQADEERAHDKSQSAFQREVERLQIDWNRNLSARLAEAEARHKVRPVPPAGTDTPNSRIRAGANCPPRCRPSWSTLRPTPYIVNTTSYAPYILHPTSYILHHPTHTSHLLHPTSYIPPPASHLLHPASCTPPPASHLLNRTPHIVCPTSYLATSCTASGGAAQTRG